MEETLTEVRDESTTEQVNGFDPFKEDSWKPQEVETVNGQGNEPAKIKETIPPESTPETQSTPNEWFKEFGFENEEVAKSEVKRLKETPPTAEEKKFANEQSKLLYDNLIDGKEDEVFNILDQKRKLTKLTSVEINENTAGDIVKLAMQNKYKEFSPEDIDYKFKKQFSIPKEPVQKDTETDDEFVERHAEWKEKSEEIKRDLIIEAKLAKPELEKLKSELVLPNIQKGNEQSEQEQQAQKELQDAELEKRRTRYLSSLSSDYKNFNGFETKYVNEGVEIPVSYTVTDEEKASLKSELESFDLDGFVLKRWFNEDGSPNVKGLMRDIYLLRNEEKIHQKIANETGVKVLDNYIKTAKNISLTGGNQNQMTLTDAKTENDKMAQFFFSQ